MWTLLLHKTPPAPLSGSSLTEDPMTAEQCKYKTSKTIKEIIYTVQVPRKQH